ncbi:MAG: gamma-glutamylcyclotransferase [Arenicellales bacterium]
MNAEESQVNPPDLSGLVFDASQHEGMLLPEGDFWLFAYGSLMWNPEFSFLRSEQARVFGYHRCLCMWSVAYRGTLEHPGLVMGLDRGGSSVGRAFLLSKHNAAEVIDQLNEREMVTGAYRSILKNISLKTGEMVQAVTLISRRDHPQYAPDLNVATTANIIQCARGARGSNLDYVMNTVQKLREMGIVDQSLEAVSRYLE